jgi:hypothetical protein
MKLIQPFKWLLPFVPLLPATQIEYIEAPNPFIMGYTANSEINTFDQVRKFKPNLPIFSEVS